jgi:glycine oxidase
MSADVVVIGGGVIGLAAAWSSARSGASVTVVDSRPASGASSVAAGMLAPVTEALWGEEHLLELNRESARRWAGYAEELEEASGLPVGYLSCGTLAVAVDQGDRAELEELHRFQVQLGLDSTWLSGREARSVEPLLAPSIAGALLAGGDHQVDNRKVMRALTAGCRNAGVETRADDVAEVDVVEDRAVGVVFPNGDRLSSGHVVLAAGCRSALVGGIPLQLRPPVRPVKGQILRLRLGPADAPIASRNLRGMVNGHSCYLVPRQDGEVVVGATAEERGFDERVTAGAVYELLRDAQRIIPGVAELELAEASAGLRPGSPDNLPIVGESGLPGLVYATGHGRNGILLTPLTAEIVAATVAAAPLPEVAALCTPARLAGVARR